MKKWLLLFLVLLAPSVGWAQIEIVQPGAGGATYDGGAVSNPVYAPSFCIDETNQDVCLMRDAANTLALRNGTAAQAFNIYNTYTDSGNYERLALYYSSNIAGIGTLRAGTGSARRFIIHGSGVNPGIEFRPGGFSSTVGDLKFQSGESPAIYTTTTDATDLGRSAELFKSLYLSRSIQGSKTKALTESSATTVFTIALADKAVTSGTVMWAVHAADATNTQMVSNEFGFDCLNEADTEACTINNHGTDTDNTPTGTLTCTDAWAYGTNTASFTLDCVSSLTQTTLNAYVRLDMLVPQTVTFP